MQPNDLPMVCLPMELPDEAAAAVVDFLQELTEALEPDYCAELLRRATATIRCLRYPMTNQPRPTIDPDNPPFCSEQGNPLHASHAGLRTPAFVFRAPPPKEAGLRHREYQAECPI